LGRKLLTGILFLLPIFDFILSFRQIWVLYLFLLILIILLFEIKINIKVFDFLLCLLIPVLWSLLFTSNFFNRDTTRSLFYLTTPLLMVFLGSCLSRVYSYQKLIEYIIFYGTASTLIYVIVLVFGHNIDYIIHPAQARRAIFFPHTIFCVLAVILLINNLSSKHIFVNLLINLYGIFISGSRTYLIVFLLFLIAVQFRLKLKHILVFIIALVVGILFITTTNNRFSKSLKELTFSKSTSLKYIGRQYRGFESLKAEEKIMAGNAIRKVFGFGLYENVDLGIKVDLGGYAMRSIPILHNGYLYLIIRTGFLGLIFYIYFFVKYYTSSQLYFTDLYRRISNGIIISLLISNIVISSFFSMELSFLWLLIGFSLSRLPNKI
jgi:hypothetical protein